MVVSSSTETDTYLSLVPIAQLIIKALILACLENLAQTQPASADCLANIPHTAFLRKLVCHILVAVGLLLELDNAGIIGIVIGGDALGDWSEAAWYTALPLGLIIFFLDFACLAGLWVVVAGGGVPELESISVRTSKINCGCL